MPCRRWMFPLPLGCVGMTSLVFCRRPARPWDPPSIHPTASSVAGQALPGTTPFKRQDDIIERQYLEIYEYFLTEIAAAPAQRDKLWRLDRSSVEAYRHSLAEH